MKLINLLKVEKKLNNYEHECDQIDCDWCELNSVALEHIYKWLDMREETALEITVGDVQYIVDSFNLENEDYYMVAHEKPIENASEDLKFRFMGVPGVVDEVVIGFKNKS